MLTVEFKSEFATNYSDCVDTQASADSKVQSFACPISDLAHFRLTWTENTINLVSIAIFYADSCTFIRNVAWNEPLVTMDYISDSGLTLIPADSTLT